ncbi:streptococcal hemagglutinin-like isoform X2 [Dermacentor albipictus]|uniref:streptococcal hemagglutinin-like isoform X2 n=1 Tax=Dermacentor albipictus TaxID=60249 RepID=UPI0038FC6890
MGNLFSRCLPRGEPADTTGLTPWQKNAVREVWRAFCKEHPEYGVLLFQAYFHKYPDHIELFMHFKGKNIRTLAMDPEFSAHCSRVGEEITSIIEALENVPVLLELLEKNALLHHHTRGVTPAHFASFGQVLVDVLHANHEDLMTPATEEAWKKFFEFVVFVIKAAYDKANSSVRGSTASSYKLATESTHDIHQRAGAGPSTDKATASDATGPALADSRRQSMARRASEILHLVSRRASLSAGSHAPTGERPAVPDTGAASAAAGSAAPAASSMGLDRRRSITKSLTDLASRRTSLSAGSHAPPTGERPAVPDPGATSVAASSTAATVSSMGLERRRSSTKSLTNLASRKTSLSAGSHAPPTGERTVVPDPGATSVAASSTAATVSSKGLERRRSSTKSLTDLVGKNVNETSAPSVPLLKRKASNVSLGEGSDSKPSEDRSTLADRSHGGASQQRSLSRRRSSKTSHSSTSLEGKPK